MSDDRLHICMTMDVERIKACSPLGGPPDWRFAERSVRSYCEELANLGFHATLFIVPDTATQQSEIFRDLETSTEAELGLHIHPQCWGDRYQDLDAYEYFGGYSGAEQRDFLEGASDQWETAIGRRPRSFRGGNFSANDETFQALVDVGFTHGSVSQPGRMVTRYRAVWADAVWDVHRPHRAFRGSKGDLPFVEVPLTSDRRRTDHWTGVGDVRIEGATAVEIIDAARHEVTRQVEEGVSIKHVCILTHNFVNYWSDDEGMGGRLGVLKAAVEGLQSVGDDLGLEAVGSTTEDVMKAFLQAERG
jgi:hypothetical protein